METFSELLARQDKEMKTLMQTQVTSWDALNEQYGKGQIPADAYEQWDQQYGNVPLHGLKAQHEAEIEAYPVNPLEYRYENETQTQPQPEPEMSTFDKMKQQRSHDLNEKLLPKIDEQEARAPKSTFEILKEQKQRQQQERDLKGFDPER